MYRPPFLKKLIQNGYQYILTLDLKLSTDKIDFMIKFILKKLKEADNERQENR